MTDSRLRVCVFRAVRGAPLLERELDALNLASRRPTPFNGRGFLQAFLDHDEFARPGHEPRLLAAVEGERLVGFLALRALPSRALGRAETKLEFLVTHDADRPDLAARPEDERRCADAFWRHLLADRGWSALELVNLDESSPLLPAPPSSRVLAAAAEGLPTAVIPTPQRDLATWYRELGKSWRHTVARLGRRFLAAGRVELVTCRDPRGRRPLLELYLDLERRSWKRDHGVGRHPARLALHRELCAEDQLLRLTFQLLLLDGAVVAGMICGEFPGTFYGLETCYDARCAALGPGNLMSLLSVHEAISRRATALNLFGGFGYYKGSWGAELVPTRTLRLHRAGSAHWVKAHLGALRRAVRRAEPDAPAERFNPVKRQVEADEGAPPAGDALPSLAAEAALAARALAALEAGGVPLERLAGEALEAALPFPPRAARRSA